MLWNKAAGVETCCRFVFIRARRIVRKCGLCYDRPKVWEAGGAMKRRGHRISAVQDGSIAQEMEIEAGDLLLAVNGDEIEDVFDYRFAVNDEYLTLLVQKPNGEEWELEVEKDPQEELGLTFENDLMDEYRSCRNKCIFCFIDQMPKGMRSTLYFKDDDSRLSFMQGNYVTLTNMKKKDIDRIIRYKLAPINISVHTTNPKLRCKMLNNRFAGEALAQIDRLFEAGIPMNGQIVLCKGVNDGSELERTIRDLAGYLPHMKSLSVVPVGLTRFREGLYPLQPFTAEDAREVLFMIHRLQDEIFARWGTHFVQAGDEWYLLAGMEMPPAQRYDGYIQLENGVGMVRLLCDEFLHALSQEKGDGRHRTQTIATGVSAAPVLERLAGQMREKFPNVHTEVCAVRNDFFGERITVSGLLTGQDIVNQLKGRALGEALLLPCNLLRSGEDVFLDDYTVLEVEQQLQTPICIVGSSGGELLQALKGEGEAVKKRWNPYS